MKAPSISIFIPAFNEEENIEDVIHEAFLELRKHTSDYEVIVVNDGSSDATGSILDRLSKYYSELRVLHHEKNLGIAKAMIDGYSQAKKELILFNSADKQAPMSHLSKMLEYIDRFDMVVGRFDNRKDHLSRIFLSRSYHSLIRLLLGIKLHNVNAIKLFRREIFDPCYSWTNSFCIDTEIVAVALRKGFRVQEISLDHFPRAAGKSTIVKPKKVVHTALHLFKIWKKVREV